MATSKKGTRTRYPGVYQLDRGTWRVVAARRSQGRQLRRELQVTGTIEDAVEARAQLMRELAEDPSEVQKRRTTVANYTERWLKRRAATLKPSTQALYIDVLGLRILPQIGTIYCSELIRADAREWVAWAETQQTRFERPFSQATLDQWWRIFKLLTSDIATDYGLAAPTHRMKGPVSPVRKRREYRTLTTEQLGRLLSSVEENYPQWLAEVTLLAYSGMRAGELYALTWDDVDELAGVIHVRHAVWKSEVGTVKTDEPREIALTKSLRDLLKGHRAQQLKDQHPGLRLGLLFPGEHGGHRGPEALRNMLRSASISAQLPLKATAQVLRRTFNTLLLQQGVDRIVLQSQMGHSSDEMTSRYAGIQASAKQAAVEGLEKSIKGGR